MKNDSILTRIWTRFVQFFSGFGSKNGVSDSMRAILHDIVGTMSRLRHVNNINAIIRLEQQEDKKYTITIQYYYNQNGEIFTCSSKVRNVVLEQMPLYLQKEAKQNDQLELTLLTDDLKEIEAACRKKISAPVAFKPMMEDILHTHVSEIQAITISDHILYYMVAVQFPDRTDEYYVSNITNIPSNYAKELETNRTVVITFKQ